MSRDAGDPAAALVAAAARHVREVVAPGVATWERDARFPRDAARAAGAAGLCGLFAPAAYGGQERGFAEAMGVFEELGRGDASYAFALSMHNAVAATLGRHGSQPMRERWARRLAEGSALGGFSLTEPQAGSDAAAITARATRRGDAFRLTGRKAWVSLAGEADVFLVACRTGRSRGARDVLMVVVDADQPGVEVVRTYDKMASAFLPIGELSLERVEIGPERVLAPPGSGLQAALAAIDVARTDIAAIAVGLAAEALDVALRYARDRAIFDGSVLDLQAIRFMLADVETDVVAGRLLYRHAAELLGREGGTVAAAHAKRFCPDAALRAAVACSEVLGANGWLHDYPLARFVALAKMLQVVDGTTEIQRVVIARDLVRRAGAL
jgi:alkylation response protein AidB-like acyl-CoA dehydrogenase